ncbi:binding-protein-dependent transport system inner membrane protein [Brachyspira hampsonii]|uniref:binding-protein-dependent transport system inner membrane protein n=1 Tax=Brachyspira hampsonii TaxID=1287055 RepID=UPI0002AE3CEE|nr:binding-protein-dependent transport system inner membrane protein [Brachyspira hampsonii]ELV05675.1 binding-protein-dependent transport system inner membrane protein [Brachyspira hampsonii 30599]
MDLLLFFKVILPMMLTGISFSLIITFIFIMGDYGVPTFASVANNRPITTAIVNAIGSQRIELGMVYGSSLIVISIIFIGLFSIFTIKNKKY